MHSQVAGVEGRHIVLLLTDNNITDEAMLADVNGLLNTGEVTGGCLIGAHPPSCWLGSAAHISRAAVFRGLD
jgi:hypothetical protein